MSDELTELPEGWMWIGIEELLKHEGALTYGILKPGDFVPDGVPMLRVMDIGDGRLNDTEIFRVSKSLDEEYKRTRLETGDIVLAVMATIGRTMVVPNSLHGANVNRALAVLKLSPLISPEFVCWSLRSPYFQKLFIDNQLGTAQKRINLSELRKFNVALPPLNEQKRIVAKIEELRDRHQRAKQALEAIPELCDRFRQSVLAAAFRGDLTADWREQNPDVESPTELTERIHKIRKQQYEQEYQRAIENQEKKPRKPSNLKPRIQDPEYAVEIPESWFWTSFEDISSIKQHAMSSEPFGSALGTKDYRDMGVPIIRGQNIQNGKFINSNFVYVSEEKALELSRSNAYPGDIVIVAVGSSGQAALVPEDLPRAVLSQNCNKFTVDQQFINPHFIILLLQHEIAKSQMQDKTTDTVRQFLSLTNLKTTLLPIPPLAEQHEIVERVNGLFSFSLIMKNRHGDIVGDLSNLGQSILAKAFRGELVDQDPNDEPASVLLDRIRAEREKAQAKSTKGRGRGSKMSKGASEQMTMPDAE